MPFEFHVGRHFSHAVLCFVWQAQYFWHVLRNWTRDFVGDAAALHFPWHMQYVRWFWPSCQMYISHRFFAKRIGKRGPRFLFNQKRETPKEKQIHKSRSSTSGLKQDGTPVIARMNFYRSGQKCAIEMGKWPGLGLEESNLELKTGRRIHRFCW